MSGSGDPLDAVQVRIYGRVQGVWFRAWTVKAATALGLAGWVRNRADGSVEALFVGLADDIESMVARCREGPPAARVDEVVREVLATPPVAEIRAAGFRQLPTL
jgi:acylphosphatase